MRSGATMPKLLVAEGRPEFHDTWQRLCFGLKVELLSMDIRGLLDRSIDAIVVPGWIAHERIGGKPELGRSQVLTNSGVIGKARWVVTPPLFAADSEQAAKLGVPEWPSKP
jgi:hypothetical protein